MEKQPSRLFYEKELKTRDAHEFARLEQEKLLVYIQPDEHSYGFGQKKPLTVVKIGGEFYGIDEDNQEKEPLRLTKGDLARYKFSVDHFLEKLRAANNLSGSSSQLDKRLFFAGERTSDSKRIALVFALLDSDWRAQKLLWGLPTQVSPGYDAILAVTASFMFKDEGLRTQLERVGVHLVALSEAGNLKVDMSVALKKMPKVVPPVVLTFQQEEEYHLYGYKCRLPINITGERTRSGSNVIFIGNKRVEVGDTPFGLFLHLVVELLANKWGIASKADLKSAGYLSDDAEFQSIRRLRECFVRALGDLDTKDFVESYRPKTLRLSVHPALLSWDKEKLLTHDNVSIRKLAAELPESVMLGL